MPFGLYNLAAKIGLPDFGISERTTGYTTRKPAVNQTYDPRPVLNYTPANFTPAPQYYSIPAAATPQYSSNKTGKVAGATTTYSAPKPKASTGRVAGATTSAPALSGDDASLLQMAKDQGRFEGLSDADRARAMRDYLSSRTTESGLPEGMSEEEMLINEMYQPTMDLLSAQRGQLQNQYSQNREYYGTYFNPQYQQLDAARQAAMALNAQNQTQVQQDQQSAIDLATKTYQELQQRNQQAYGGVSSAGEFGREIGGRELQRNIGEATTTGAKNLATLRQQLSDIDSNYQTMRQQIDSQKNQALIELQQAFEQSLQQIDSQQASISGSKAADKLNALREFNANKNAIMEQTNSLIQQLAANQLQARQQYEAAIGQYQAQAGQTPNLNPFTGPDYTQYLPSVSQEGAVNPLLPLKRRLELGLA